ncbi:hypothetical protein FOZ63_007027, partial [Perkinsus olseni]
MEAAVVTPGPSREDISAAVEAARREAAVVSGEKVSRLEEEKIALKKELQERKDQIRCQRQAYEALEQQLRLSTKQEQSRIAELTDELRSEKNASKSGHPVKHFALLRRQYPPYSLFFVYLHTIIVSLCGSPTVRELTEYFDAEVVGSTFASNLISGYRRIFSGRGTPHRICSDRGPAYVSAQYRLFLSKHTIQHHLVPSASPRYGRKWERSHGPLNQKLRVLCAI